MMKRFKPLREFSKRFTNPKINGNSYHLMSTIEASNKYRTDCIIFELLTYLVDRV